MSTSVLVVDSNREFAILIRQSLEESGRYSVSLANSGEEALTLAAQGSFDIAIVDLDLPDFPGAEILRRLHESKPDLRLIAIPRAGMADLPRDEAVPIERVLNKPFYLPELPDILKKTLEATRKPARDDRSERERGADGGEDLAEFVPPAAELPPQLRSLEQVQDRLVSGLTGSGAEGALLLRDGRPVARAGAVSSRSLEEIASAIPDPRSRGRGGDVARFLRSGGQSTDRLMYSKPVTEHLILALLFPGETPITKARRETGRFARRLIEGVEDDAGAHEAEVEADDLERSQLDRAQPRPAESSTTEGPAAGAGKADPPGPEPAEERRPAPSEHAHVLDRQAMESDAPHVGDVERAPVESESAPEEAPGIDIGTAVPPEIDAGRAEPVEPEHGQESPPEVDSSPPDVAEADLQRAGSPEPAPTEAQSATVDQEPIQTEAEPPEAPEPDAGPVADSREGLAQTETTEADSEAPTPTEVEARAGEADPERARAPSAGKDEHVEEIEPGEPQVSEPGPAPIEAHDSDRSEDDSAETESGADPLSQPPAAEAGDEPAEPAPDRGHLPDDWVPESELDPTQQALLEEWADLEPPAADPESEPAPEPEPAAGPADRFVMPKDWVPQEDPPAARSEFFDDMLRTRAPEMNGEAETGPKAAPIPEASYHLSFNAVLIPRFPEHELTGELASQVQVWTHRLCLAWDWRADGIRVDPDALRLALSLIPESAPAEAIERLMHDLSTRILDRYPQLEKELPSGRFWARPYLLTSGDPPGEDRIRRFIRRARQAQGFER